MKDEPLTAVSYRRGNPKTTREAHLEGIRIAVKAFVEAVIGAEMMPAALTPRTVAAIVQAAVNGERYPLARDDDSLTAWLKARLGLRTFNGLFETPADRGPR